MGLATNRQQNVSFFLLVLLPFLSCSSLSRVAKGHRFEYEIKFIVCVAGIYISYLAYGYYQEAL